MAGIGSQAAAKVVQLLSSSSGVSANLGNRSQEEARQNIGRPRVVYVYSVDTRNTLISGFLGVRRERKIGGNDFLVLNQQFNTLIKAGLPILRALDLLATRASAPKLRPVLTQIRWFQGGEVAL